jgi:Protein of unknown function (DUF2934)
MTDSYEDRVRERAYEMWEEEGKPEGEHSRHWNNAEDELRRDTTEANQKAREQIAETGKKTGESDIPIQPPSIASPD